MKYEIDQQLLEKILNYLATQPYNQVAKLISEVQESIKPVRGEQDDS